MKKILVYKSDNKRSQLIQIINALKDSFHFQVFSSDKNFCESSTLAKKDCKYLKSIGEPKTFGDYFFYSLLSPFLGAHALTRLINFKIKKYDAVILTSLQDLILITPWAKLCGYKVYWYINRFLDPTFKANIYSLWLRLWSRFVISIATSESVAKYLTKEIGWSKDHLITISRGLDLSHLKEQGDIYEDLANQDYQIKNEALFIIGFIGDLKEENGLEYLIKACEHFKELIPDFQIIIVGEGDQKKSLMWLTKMAGLANHIRFVGRQDHVQRWYKYFDILVFPRTIKTNFANVVAEAMGSGIPVVASDLDGIHEIVNGQGGILVPPKNAHALAEAMFTLYNDKSAHAQFAKQATARIQKEYSMDNMIKKYLEIFNQ